MYFHVVSLLNGMGVETFVNKYCITLRILFGMCREQLLEESEPFQVSISYKYVKGARVSSIYITVIFYKTYG